MINENVLSYAILELVIREKLNMTMSQAYIFLFFFIFSLGKWTLFYTAEGLTKFFKYLL